MGSSSRKHALVTGAAKGIGRAAALALAARGFEVFAGLRELPKPSDAAWRHQAGVTPLELDVCSPASIEAARDRVQQAIEGQGLAVLVNNAGRGLAGPLELGEPAELRALFETNVFGACAVAQAFLPLLRTAHGRIVNVGSVSGRHARPFLGGYSASKAALDALSDAWRMELRPWKIDVVVVAAGRVKTSIWQQAADGLRQIAAQNSPDVVRRYQPVLDGLTAWANRGDGLEPEQVANMICQAATAAHPRRRYVVGSGRVLDALGCALPPILRDWLLTRRLPPYG